MAALSADRMSRVRSLGRTFSAKVLANAIPYQGGLVSVGTTGYAKASGTTAGDRVIGWSTAKVDNTGGADGAVKVQVQTGLIKLDNDGTNPVAQADVGRLCFVKDDHTVQNGVGGSAVVAGRIDEIDADGGVWVYVDDVVGGTAGSGVDIVGDNNTSGGIPLIHVFNIADTGASQDVDLVLKEKFEVLDVTVIKSAAGAGNTLTVKNLATAITNAIVAAVDKTVTRAGTIDPAQSVIAAGGTLRASVTWAAGSGAMKVIVTGRKAA